MPTNSEKVRQGIPLVDLACDKRTASLKAWFSKVVSRATLPKARLVRAFFCSPRAKNLASDERSIGLGCRRQGRVYLRTMKNAALLMFLLGTGAIVLLLAGRLIDARKLRGGHWDIAISAIVIAAIAAIGIFLSTDHDDWLQSIMGRRH